MCHCTHVVRVQLVEVGAVVSCGFLGLNSGGECLATDEPSCQSLCKS